MKWVKSITNSNCEYTVSGMYGRKIDEYLNRLESALYINKADSNLFNFYPSTYQVLLSTHKL